MLRLPSFAVGLLLAACIVVPARAQTLIVMCDPYPPYALAKGLHVTGVSVEAMAAIMEMTGNSFDRKSVRLVNRTKGMDAALALPNCILLNVPRTAEVEGKYQWIGPLDFPELALIGKAGRDFGIKSLADASAYSIAAVRGGVPARELLAQGLDPSCLKLDSLYIQPLRALQSGQVDLVAFPLENVTYLMRNLGLEQNDYDVAYVYKRVPLYIAVSRGVDPALIKRLNEALAAYKSPMADGNSVFDKSMARYLPYGTVE